jgi:hypothetical protein
LRKYLLITVLILIICGLFVWWTSVYRGADRQFLNSYQAYRGIAQPDSTKLDEWDKQMTDAYVAAKEAFTAGDEEQAPSHLKVMGQIIGAQEEFCLKLNGAYTNEAKALPDVKARAQALSGNKKVIAERIALNESEILKIGRELNNGSIREMGLWRRLSANLSQFMNKKINGSMFLATENDISAQIGSLRETQVKPGQKAEGLVKKINTDWKELKPLL